MLGQFGDDNDADRQGARGVAAAFRLMPSAGNTGKLIAANTLVRGVYRLFQGVKVRVQVDSWFMRRIFIASMQSRGVDVIGQVRGDTRLYDEPGPRKPGQRGWPRKYGEKYTPQVHCPFKVDGDNTKAVRQRTGGALSQQIG